MKPADTNSLREYWNGLKDELSVTEFEQLREALQVSQYQFTMMQNGNRDFTYEELVRLGQFLKVPPIELVEKHGLGLRTMTAQQHIMLAEQSGKRLGYQDQ